MTISSNEDVRWFDVAMDDTFRVRSVQTVSHANRHFEQLFQLHGPTSNDVFQCLAFQKLHSDERAAVFFADVMNRANVWMIQCRSCLRLSLKPCQRLGVFCYSLVLLGT